MKDNTYFLYVQGFFLLILYLTCDGLARLPKVRKNREFNFLSSAVSEYDYLFFFV